MSITRVDPRSIEIPKKPPHKSASEHRRATKPIMEKRRRARINGCLDQIKSLVLSATNRDPAKHAKLEKADILEMTVEFLRNVTLPGTTLVDKSSAIKSLKSGFDECAQEVESFVDIDMDLAMKRRLVNHLKNNFNANNLTTVSDNLNHNLHHQHHINNNNNLVSSTTSPSLKHPSSPVLAMKSEPSSPHPYPNSHLLGRYTPPPSADSSDKASQFSFDSQYHTSPIDDAMDCIPVDCSKSSKLNLVEKVWRPWSMKSPSVN